MAPLMLPGWMNEPSTIKEGAIKEGFLEKNISIIVSFTKVVASSHQYAGEKGLLQSLGPVSRTLGIFVLVLAGAAIQSVLSLIAYIFLIVAIAACSSAALKTVLKRGLPIFVFTLLVTLPVFFGFFSKGEKIIGVKLLNFEIAVTQEGLTSGAMLLMRAVSMAILASLFLLTTKENDIFKGLRGLWLPGVFITVLFMTLRYLLLLLKIAEDMMLSKKSRTINASSLKHCRRWFADRVTLLLERALYFSKETSQAMASRGFKGSIRTLSTLPLNGKDYLWLMFCFFILFLSILR